MQFSNFKGIVFLFLGIVVVFFAFVFNDVKTGIVEKINTAKIIYSVVDDEISSVAVENKTGKFSFERCEEKEVTKDGKEIITIVYKVKDKPEMLLDQDAVRVLLRDLYTFHTIDMVCSDATEEDLVKFGFGNEWNTITVNETDGSSHTFILGGTSKDGSERYVMKGGENKIYSMVKVKEESFLNDLNTYRERRLGTFGSYTLLSFSITDKGVRKLGIRMKNRNDTEVVTTDSISYVMILPFNGAISIEKFDDVMMNFDEVVVEDFVEEGLDNLWAYGLDDANSLKVVIQDSEKHRHELHFGKIDEKGNVYTLYNDNKFVFTTNPKMYNAVKDLNPADFMEVYANLYRMTEVERVAVTGTEEAYVLDIKRGEQTEYYINDKFALDKGFKAIYQGIIDLKISEHPEEEKKEKELLDITFTFRDGSKKTTKYYEYDIKHYGAYMNDGSYGLVEKKSIDKLLEVLDIFDEKPHLEP